MADWFTQNAPKSPPAAVPAGGGDWFAANAPNATSAVLGMEKLGGSPPGMPKAPSPETVYKERSPLGKVGIPPQQAVAFGNEMNKESAEDLGGTLATAAYAIPGAGPAMNVVRGAASGAGQLAGRRLMGDKPTAGEAIGTMALSAGPPALAAMAPAISNRAGKIGQSIYQTILKPSTANSQAQNAAIVNTGLKEGIPLTKWGRQQLQGKVAAIDDQVAENVARGNAEGLTVDPENVAARTARSTAEFEKQVDPNGDLSAISGVKGRFLDRHSTKAPYTKVRPMDPDEGVGYTPAGAGETQVPKPLGLLEAQEEKQGTYRRLRGKYGELSNAEVESQKDLARGLKEEVYGQIRDKYGVDLTALGQRESRLLDLDGAMERFLNRHGNNQHLGIGPGIHAAGAAAIGGPKLATVAALANFFLEKSPAIASRLAILAANMSPSGMAGAVNNTGAAARIATTMLPLKRLDQ